MGRILQELGADKEKLVLEKEAVDTTTNAFNVLKLVRDEVLVKQVVLKEAQKRTGGGGDVFLSSPQKSITGESSADNSEHCLPHAKVCLAFQVICFHWWKSYLTIFLKQKKVFDINAFKTQIMFPKPPPSSGYLQQRRS